MGKEKKDRAIRRAVKHETRREIEESIVETVRGYARSAFVWKLVAAAEAVALVAIAAIFWR